MQLALRAIELQDWLVFIFLLRSKLELIDVNIIP